VALEKAVGVGARLDVVFGQLRIGLFFNDIDVIQRNIEKARTLVDEGGDWDRRNRLKVYEGIYLSSIRDFKKAAGLLLDGLATFTSTELMEYKDFVKYTSIAAAVAVQRSEFKKKVLDSPEILEVIHEIPHLESYIQSLYQCKYAEFFKALAHVESYLKYDRYLAVHYRWYTREMRILAYTQLLESYRSVTLASMAQLFGVSVEFIDRDVSKFIAAGRLNCVIDKVGGVVETNRPDSKNAQYQNTIKQGDLLLNRVQKLSRVINV
jgi:26S proteasome regulatory subunit N7